MPVLFPVTSVLFSVPVLGRFLQFFIPVANYPWQRDLSRQVRYDQTILDTFDMLSPRYDRPLTSEEVRSAIGPLADGLQFRSTRPVVIHGTRI